MVLVNCAALLSCNCLFLMAIYHPLDTRHKANKTGGRDRSGKPRRNVKDLPVPPGAKSGPIRDSDAMERRAREDIGRKAERDAIEQAPLVANLFGPATLYYRIRAALIGERARGYGNGRIALNIAGAFVLYVLFVYLDSQFGLNDVLTGSSSMRTID